MKALFIVLMTLTTTQFAQADLTASYCHIRSANGVHTVEYNLITETGTMDGQYSSSNEATFKSKIEQLKLKGLACSPIDAQDKTVVTLEETSEKKKVEIKRDDTKKNKKTAGVVIDNTAAGVRVQSYKPEEQKKEDVSVNLELSGNTDALTYNDSSYRLRLEQGSLVIGGSTKGFNGGLRFDVKESEGLMAGGKYVKVFFGGRSQLNGQLIYNPSLPNHLEGSLGVEMGLALKFNEDFLMKIGPMAQGSFSLMVNEDDYAALQAGGIVELALLDNVLISASSAVNVVSTLDNNAPREKHQGGIYLQLADGKLQIGAEGSANLYGATNSDRSLLELQERQSPEDRLGLEGGLKIRGYWQ